MRVWETTAVLAAGLILAGCGTGTGVVSGSRSVGDAAQVPPGLTVEAVQASGRVVQALATHNHREYLLVSPHAGSSWSALPVTDWLTGFSRMGSKDLAAIGCAQQCLMATSLFVSHDGGHHWTRRYRAPKGWVLASIDFVNSQNGWVLLARDRTGGLPAVSIRRTTNGGKTWTSESLPTFVTFSAAMHFVSRERGFVIVGGEPGAGEQWKKLYQTDNGGRTWTVAAHSPGMGGHGGAGTLPVGGYVNGLDFVTARIGYLGLMRGPLERTDNGGKTWHSVASDTFQPDVLAPESLSFVNGQEGYAVGAGVLYRTTNAGRHWSVVYPKPHS